MSHRGVNKVAVQPTPTYTIRSNEVPARFWTAFGDRIGLCPRDTMNPNQLWAFGGKDGSNTIISNKGTCVQYNTGTYFSLGQSPSAFSVQTGFTAIYVTVSPGSNKYATVTNDAVGIADNSYTWIVKDSSLFGLNAEARSKLTINSGWKSMTTIGIEVEGSGSYVSGSAVATIHSITQASIYELLKKYSDETHFKKTDVENEWQASGGISVNFLVDFLIGRFNADAGFSHKDQETTIDSTSSGELKTFINDVASLREEKVSYSFNYTIQGNDYSINRVSIFSADASIKFDDGLSLSYTSPNNSSSGEPGSLVAQDDGTKYSGDSKLNVHQVQTGELLYSIV